MRSNLSNSSGTTTGCEHSVCEESEASDRVQKLLVIATRRIDDINLATSTSPSDDDIAKRLAGLQADRADMGGSLRKYLRFEGLNLGIGLSDICRPISHLVGLKLLGRTHCYCSILRTALGLERRKPSHVASNLALLCSIQYF